MQIKLREKLEDKVSISMTSQMNSLWNIDEEISIISAYILC